MGNICLGFWKSSLQTHLSRYAPASIALRFLGEDLGFRALQRTLPYKHLGGPERPDLEQCLNLATSKGYVSCMRLLFAASISYFGEGFLCSPIHIAVQGGHPPALELLLNERIVYVNVYRSGITPLWRALQQRNAPMVGILLDRGADWTVRFNTRISNGLEYPLSPVSYAAWADDSDLMKTLLDHGLDVEDPRYSRRPLIVAIHHRNIKMVQLLLDHGADLNSPEYVHYWPLYEAVRIRAVKIVQLLLERGADANLCVDGEKPLRLAKQNEDHETVQLLLKHGARDCVVSVSECCNWRMLRGVVFR
jgi:ankyrin repeat protein